MTPDREPHAFAALGQAIALVAFNVALLAGAMQPAIDRAFSGALGATVGTLAVNLILGVAMLTLAAIFTRRDPDRRAAFGLVAVKVATLVRWAIVVAVGSKLVLMPFELVLRAVHGHSPDASIPAIEQFAGGQIAVVIAVALWAGIWEELVFRGFILARLRTAGGRWFSQKAANWFAVVGQAALFGLVHLWQSPHAQLESALTGAVLGYAVIRCGSIIPGMIGHAAIDVFGFAIARAGLLK